MTATAATFPVRSLAANYAIAGAITKALAARRCRAQATRDQNPAIRSMNQ